MDALKLLGEIFERNSDQILFIDTRTNNEITYGEFLDQSLRLASLLSDSWVGRGSQVLFSMDNCVELAALYFACMHLGAQIVPINPALHANDFKTIIDANQPHSIFVSADVFEKSQKVISERPQLKVFCIETSCEPAAKGQKELINLDIASELGHAKRFETPFGMARNDDVFLKMYTSGTASSPKGVCITYERIVGNGSAFCQRLSLNESARFFNFLPMTYLGGFYNLMLIPIIAEASIVLDAPLGGSNLYGFWEIVKERKIDTLWFTATVLSLLLSIDDGEDLSFLKDQIKIALCGMAPLPIGVKKRFEQRFGFALYENYALSETLFLTTNYPGLKYKDGSTGLSLPGVSLHIVDENLAALPAGNEGQVVVKTPFFMAEYSGATDADLATLTADGFLTGDLGYIDSDGELFVSGRKKDLIIRGGINISPRQIEDVVYKHEAVDEVAVLGIPNPIYGEEVAAVIKLRPTYNGSLTADDFRPFIEENIAHYQRPKSIYLIDEMPKGVTGKINKNLLRRLVVEKTDPLSG